MLWLKVNLAGTRVLKLGLLAALQGPTLSSVAAPLEIPRTLEPPQIDGILEEPIWQGTTPIEEFYQREPRIGDPVSEKTLVWIALDRRNIYFAFRCYDDPASITAKELARDVSLAEDDRVQIILDTFLDRRNAYWFQIGPRGSIGDALVSENGERFNKQWDGLWNGKARIHDEGWDAEIIIPFKTLRFRPGQDEWGLKLIRHIKSKEEVAYWPVANLNTFRFQVSDAGLVSGMKDINQGIGLDIRPYGLFGVNQFAGGNNEGVADAGLDLFYQLTPGLSSALTLNTDFAETEVDLRRVNLTRFPLFFPEKRDFFLDGANYFDFGPSQQSLIPFFSRTVGLDSQGNPIPILWGLKVTGQQSEWNLGLLAISDDPAEERRDFFVGRVSRNIGGQSSLGMILTHGNALSNKENQVMGVDLRLASSTFRGNKNISLSFIGLKSNTDGVSGRNTAAAVQFLYPNDFLDIGAGLLQIEENFVAGAGFVPRSGVRIYNAQVRLGPRPERLGIRQINFGAVFDYITNCDNRLETRQVVLEPLLVRFDSGDLVGLEVVSRYEFLDEEFRIHPDFVISEGEYQFNRYSAGFQSARRRDLWLSSVFTWGSFFDGHRRDSELALGYKIMVPIFLGTEYSRNRVDLPEGGFTVNISRLNLNVLFSPNVTLYNFLQYDNQSRNLGIQSRFYWILKPGNEIILAWNSRWNEPLQRLEMNESTARLKINYNFRF